MDYNVTKSSFEGIHHTEYHVIHRRPVGDMVVYSHKMIHMIHNWIKTEATARRERKARMIAKIEADDLSDYRSEISSLTGEERELKKMELIDDINDFMSDLHYDIVEEKAIIKTVWQKVTTP